MKKNNTPLVQGWNLTRFTRRKECNSFINNGKTVFWMRGIFSGNYHVCRQ
jgi:hypothetical protein